MTGVLELGLEDLGTGNNTNETAESEISVR